MADETAPQEEEQPAQGTHIMGLERWVQFAFIGAAVVVFWLLDHIIEAVWNIFAEPPATIVTSSAVVAAVLLCYAAYKIPKYHRFVFEVATELSKVTWPTRKEAWAQTIVVVVVSVIAAIIIGIFDAMWSAVTDLIYRV
jgi:preprotein translocase subunit SecE